MHTIHLYERLTRSYAPGWAHLDRQEYLTYARVTPARMVRQPQDFDDGGEHIFHVTIPSGATRKEYRLVRQALIDAFTTSTCRHEYDCCGCAVRFASVKRTRRNRYVIHQKTSFNY